MADDVARRREIREWALAMAQEISDITKPDTLIDDTDIYRASRRTSIKQAIRIAEEHHRRLLAWQLRRFLRRL